MKWLRIDCLICNDFNFLLGYFERSILHNAGAMRSLLIFLIILAFYQTLCGTETQQCPAFGSEQSIYGWMLQRHIYKTTIADLGLDCLLVCRRDDRCQSFNFVMSLHMCEFSDRTKEARPEDFIPDPDRYYFRQDINRVHLGSIPELAAESCKEIKASEGQAASGKYWLSSIKSDKAVLAYCDMKTEDVNECTASSPLCDVNAICNNTIGSYRCTCKLGFSGNGRTCTDVNECTASSPVCDVNAICNNTIGSYRCTCKLGFSGDGRTCTDINECTASSPVCGVNAICTNTIGSYRCTCKLGFSGNGRTCTDINECTSSPSVCDVNANCYNTAGSYSCSCKPGFGGDGETCRVESCHALKRTDSTTGDGIHSISTPSLTFQVHCDMTSSGQGWTLVARFSNIDAKNWMQDSGEWWYDKSIAVGGTTDPSSNSDMISPAFWLVSGQEFKITRSDDSQHTPLLQTSNNCLDGKTFRSKIASYGNFRNGTVWASDICLGSCNVQYSGQYKTTQGFQQATCTGNMQTSNRIGFWCDWSAGDGAVMMIGGGGNCSRADHGIGITEANAASFVDAGTTEEDFGDNIGSITNLYSLNLWIK